jgi:curli biogenesis system outer membrane secretion channel CsgG
MKLIANTLLALTIASLPVLAWGQAGTTTRVTQGSGQSMADVRAEDYNGPKARIAVARFENKTADSSDWYSASIGDGMADMLTTALVNSGRYIVLERANLDTVIDEQDLGASGRIRADTAAAIGEIEGAELLVVAAVTEFDADSGGMQIGGSGLGNRVLGAITGGSRSAHMAIDLRVVDSTTSRILAATSVEGEAQDFNIGGALAGWTGSVNLSGDLSSWENTPREKALREVIGKAVEYVISVTPPAMLRYDSMGNPVSTQTSASSTAASSGGDSGERVVITAPSVDALQGPSEATATVFSVPAGTIVSANLRAGDWVQIIDDQGRTGWVPSEHTLEVQ